MRAFPLVSACAALAIAGAAASSSAEEARVTFLHTTDLHGALEAPAPTGGGLVRLATHIRAARAEGPPVLLVDAGDCIEGGIEDGYRASRSKRPDPMIAALGALGYDALVVGNHEFDFGSRVFEAARKQARFPFLAANVVRAKDGRPALAPSLVRTAGPLRIGVVGVTTPATPSFLPAARVAGLRFDEPIAAARREVERLRRDERCDAVIVVAHTGLEAESEPASFPDENWGRRLATQVAGIDVLVLGHTHVVLPATPVAGVLVTQAGHRGRGIGRVDLVFTRPGPEAPWRLTTREGRFLAAADTLAPDPEIQSLARSYESDAAPALDAIVGHAPVPIDAPLGRSAPGSLWELIHRAQLWATGADVSLATIPDPRVRVEAGEVTRREILALYPYGNELEVVELTARQLREVLERSAAALPEHRFDGAPTEWPGPGFDTAHGVSYAVDRTRAPGQRIAGLSIGGAPLDDGRRLRVAVNSYRANGGGGFEMLRGARRVAALQPRGVRLPRDGVTVRDAIAGFLAIGSWRGESIASWTMRPAYAAFPEHALADRLVRHGALARDAALALDPTAPATWKDLDAWVAGAFGHAPPPQGERSAIDVSSAADAIAGAASSILALDSPDRRAAFVRSLATGTSLAGAATGRNAPSRIQLLGMISNARFPTIRVLETTDFHGAILPGQRDRRTQRPVGGSPILAAWIERLRAENPEGTVLIDGGDLYQGTMISNLQFGRPVIEQMNALGYAAAAIGNHEFDWSADTLERRVREMSFAALGANMRLRTSGTMPPWVRSDTIVVRRGVRVGILGLCYRFTPSVTLARHVAHLEFLDDSTVAARLAPDLRRRSDVVVGVGHVPSVSDSTRRSRGGDLPRLARGVSGVDAWFGGHSHNPVADHVGGIPVAIAGSHGQFVAVCDLVVDVTRDSVVESRVRLQDTFADSIAADEAMAARVARWNESVAPIASQPLGRNEKRLTRYRSGESSLGNFVTDAIRAAAGTDIAFQNSGGLRADLPEGPVTVGSIYEVMPFDNRVFTLDLSGAEIKKALEQALVSQRITQVSGIRYTFDLGREPLDRVVSLTTADGAPLDPRRRYTLACNDFMATGGDDYDVLTRGRKRVETDLLVRDVIEDYVASLTRAGKAIEARTEGRIQRTGATRPQREN